MMKKLLLLLSLIYPLLLVAQHTTEVAPLKGERWWGGMVAAGSEMPFAPNTRIYDLNKENRNNQTAPLLLSSAGRYVWGERPFRFQFRNDSLILESDYENLEVVVAGNTLKDAYLAASTKYFPFNGHIPESLFFSQPQYNTWIELMYNQNQEDILNYARQALANGFPPGIFMVDDNWQCYYGNFDFKAEKFPDPKAMCDELHRLGFKIMLWICPFYSADTPEFREMEQKGYLLKNKTDGNTAIIKWWNGYSACLDVTNPKAVAFFKSKLEATMQRYGVDGFKFDAGDIYYMTGDYAYFDKTADKHLFSQRWAEIGAYFPYNELRAAWKTGGMPIVQRLGDKSYSWHSSSLIVPDMSAARLLGYAYTCPDMIGGGEFKSFLNVGDKKLDEELIVRSCQIHALMPMMQFSVAPWRVLSKENMEICSRYARLHEQMGDYILECARNSAQTGEPIVRNMEYAYPHQGFEECKDQFMLGSRFLVAPMVKKGTVREVWLPKGIWRDDQGKKIRGPKSLTIEVPLNRLPYYERIK